MRRSLLPLVFWLFATLAYAETHALNYKFLAAKEGTPAQRDLGNVLFFDRNVGDGTTSCADCHNPDPKFAFGDQRQIALGRIGPNGVGRQGIRRSPFILNVYAVEYLQTERAFLDLREPNMLTQALGPIANPDEMANQTPQQMCDRLNQDPKYPPLCRAAFGDGTLTPDRFSAAIVAFGRTFKAIDTPLTRWFDGDKTAFYPFKDPEACARGAELFRKNCIDCHQPPTYTTGRAANTGVEFTHGNKDQGVNGTGAFKIPGLVAVSTRKYLTHKGDFDKIRDLLAHYNAGANYGGTVDPRLDSRIKKLDLTARQFNDLVMVVEKGLIPYDYPDIKPKRR